MHSKYLGDDKKSYADVLLLKAIKIHNYIPWKHEEAFELLNNCLEFFSDDKENSKLELLETHRHLAAYNDDDTIFSIDDKIMHGRKAIKLEREIYGEIRRNGQSGVTNCYILKIWEPIYAINTLLLRKK